MLCCLLDNMREEICTTLPTLLPLKAEETTVVESIKMQEDLCLKPIYTAAYMLDLKYAGMSVLSGEKINIYLGLDVGKVLAVW